MNRMGFQDNWDSLIDLAREYWSELNEQQLGSIRGNKDELQSALEHSYGLNEEEARCEIARFLLSCESCEEIASNFKTDAVEIS